MSRDKHNNVIGLPGMRPVSGVNGPDGRPLLTESDLMKAMAHGEVSDFAQFVVPQLRQLQAQVKRLSFDLETANVLVRAIIGSAEYRPLEEKLHDIDIVRAERWRVEQLPRVIYIADQNDGNRPCVTGAVDEGKVSTTVTILVEGAPHFDDLDGETFTDADKGEAVRAGNRAVSARLATIRAADQQDQDQVEQ